MFEIYKKVPPSFEHLSINEQNIDTFVKDISLDDLIIPDWKEEPFLIKNQEADINFLFLINTINFSYWPDKGINKWKFFFRDKEYSGSMALFCALKKALQGDYPLFDPNYLKNISEADLEHILVGTEKIPMFEERLEILRSIGLAMENNNIASFYEIYQKSEHSAIKLVNLLSDIFESFGDQFIYKEVSYPFYKRAQLVAAMIYGRYQNEKPFYDIDKLTVFADYRVPQTLRKLGLIDYYDSLSDKISNQEYLEEGSSEELEIRLSCIYASELIKQKLEVLHQKPVLNSIQLDYFLWKNGKSIKEPNYDFHRTRSIYY